MNKQNQIFQPQTTFYETEDGKVRIDANWPNKR